MNTITELKKKINSIIAEAESTESSYTSTCKIDDDNISKKWAAKKKEVMTLISALSEEENNDKCASCPHYVGRCITNCPHLY